MSQLKEDAEFVLKDLKAHYGVQSTWDWEADFRFAIYAGDEEAAETLKLIDKSHAPIPFMLAAHRRYCRKVKERRLKALRYLKKQGVAGSVWSGFRLYDEELIRVNNYYLVSESPGL